MDKSKAAADAVKLINQAKEDSNLQPLMIKAVCFFRHYERKRVI